jgi:DUF177 domain-containing protein
MSGPLHTWYSLPDLERLAERGSVLKGEIELKRLARLREILLSDDGAVAASLTFRRREGGCLVADLAYEAALSLACQRCLEPLTHVAKAEVEIGIVENESMQACLPDGCEVFVLGDDRLLPSRLIEDELIVSLPLVPRHAGWAQCGPLARDWLARYTEPDQPVDDTAPNRH